jgi:hypothetical protein
MFCADVKAVYHILDSATNSTMIGILCGNVGTEFGAHLIHAEFRWVKVLQVL